MSKYYKVIACAFVILSFMTLNSLRVDASTAEDLKNTWYDTHYYPINQKSSEWQKHSMIDTLEANNPPYDLLFSMTSEELAELIFECPYLPQITTYCDSGEDDFGMYFMFIESNSDIFYELLRREDGILAILKRYQESGIDCKWFAEGPHDYSVDEQNRWYAEVFGSQFVHFYSKKFTKEETDLAKQIISEKTACILKAQMQVRHTLILQILSIMKEILQDRYERYIWMQRILQKEKLSLMTPRFLFK